MLQINNRSKCIRQSGKVLLVLTSWSHDTNFRPYFKPNGKVPLCCGWLAVFLYLQCISLCCVCFQFGECIIGLYFIGLQHFFSKCDECVVKVVKIISLICFCLVCSLVFPLVGVHWALSEHCTHSWFDEQPKIQYVTAAAGNKVNLIIPLQSLSEVLLAAKLV